MKERVLFITGSSGIGAATAQLAASRGDRIFLFGKDPEQCAVVSANLPAASFYVGDVSSEGAVDHAVKTCLCHFGRIDAVFNVAGLSGRSMGDGPLHECKTEAWRLLMDVHALGTFLVCRRVIQHWLTAKQEGTILNTGSVLARYPERRYFATHAYAASKGAVESLTLSAASYYASHRIRLNLLAPGLVRTPMSQRAQSNPDILQYIAHKQPLTADLIDVEDLAGIAHFLLSPESVPMTGEIIRADAGWAVTG